MKKTQVDLLKEHRIEVKGHRGQHLLVDPNIQNKIVDLLEISHDEWIIEIGPGLGAVTGPMLERGARVIAVEKDARFVQILEKEYAEAVKGGRLILTAGDILSLDFNQLLKEGEGVPARKAVSNLPYYITGPVLFTLLSHHESLEKAVLMMQREVAERIFAEPGSKSYGRLSVGVRLFAHGVHAFDVSPGCFRPSPEVDSSVVVFNFHRKLKEFLGNVPQSFALDFIKACFSQRRKKLISVLSRHPAWAVSRHGWEELFKKNGVSKDARAEELLPKDFIRLSRDLWQVLSDKR